MIYLDNAATTSPKPEIVIREVDRAMRLYSANPGRGGHTASVAAAEAVFRTRSIAKGFFHVLSEENVIFTPGCTHSLNMVIKGLLKKGDHVVISSFEHNAVLRPLHQMKEKGLIDYSVANITVGDDDATVDAFRRAINENTRLIICTHASNVYGFILPVRRICALAHSYGIAFCLDAAQSAGVLPIDMEKDGFDYVCCAGHKGLYGPSGIGLLLLKNQSLIEPLVTGGTGSESIDPLNPEYYPDRLESGTLNIPGICGLGAGIRFVTARKPESIFRHEMGLLQLAYREMKQNDRIQLYIPLTENVPCAPVLSFNIKNHDSESVAAYLNRRYHIATRAGLHCAPLAHRTMGTIDTGTVRIAPSVFTTEKDVRILIKAAKNFIHFS